MTGLPNKMELDEMKDTSKSNELLHASTNNRNVEDEDSRCLAVDDTGTITAIPTATATSTTVVRGVLPNVLDPPDTASSSPTQRLRKGRGRFQASKGHPIPNVPDLPDTTSPSPTQRQGKGHGRFQSSKGHPGKFPMVHDDNDRHCPVAATTAAARNATKRSVNPDAKFPAVDTESHGRSVNDAEAIVPSPEPTTLSTTSAAPILEAYLAPELGRGTTVEVVDAVVWDDTDIIRSDRRKWAFFFGGTLLVGAVIIVVAMSVSSRTRNKNVVINDSPSSAPTTILSSTGRLGDIFREIMTHFESPTLEQDLKNPKSPQYRAALWMAEEDEHPATANLAYPLNETSLDLLQFRQRYALATFYYATGGDEWANPCNFLSPSLHVCDWNCEWDSEPYWDIVWEDFEYTSSDLFVNYTTMGAFCGIHDMFFGLPPVLDDLVLSLVIGT